MVNEFVLGEIEGREEGAMGEVNPIELHVPVAEQLDLVLKAVFKDFLRRGEERLLGAAQL